MRLGRLLSLIFILSLFSDSVVVRASIAKQSIRSRLADNMRHLLAEGVGQPLKKFVVRGDGLLAKIGRGAAVGLVATCLASSVIDGCGIADDESAIVAIDNYSRGLIDHRFSQLSEKNLITYRQGRGLSIVEVLDVATSVSDTVYVRSLRGYGSPLDFFEPQWSWDNRLIELGATISRLLWHRPYVVASSELGEPLVLEVLTTAREVDFTPIGDEGLFQSTDGHLLIEALPGVVTEIAGRSTDIEKIDGKIIAAFGVGEGREYLVRIISTNGDQSANWKAIELVVAKLRDREGDRYPIGE